jgi:hypothetical protein
MDNPAEEAKKQLDDLRWMLKMWLLLGKLGAFDENNNISRLSKGN